MPEGLEPSDDDQRTLVAELQEAEIGSSVEVVRAPLDAFKAHVLDLLRSPSPPPVEPAATGDGQRVYLVHDRADREAIGPLQTELERRGHVVMLPLGEGSEVEAQEVHETSMVLCDAVIIFYGAASEHWVRMKLFDLLKAPRWAQPPFRAAAVWVVEPVTPHKRSYSTDEALVLRATEGFAPGILEPFLDRLAPAAPGR